MRIYLTILLILILGLAGCQNDKEKFDVKRKIEAEKKITKRNIPEIDVKADTTLTGLVIQVFQEGTGAIAKVGDSVKVHYTGWLTNGQKFDSSIPRKAPLPLKLGAGSVIQGWEEGIVGMKKGEKRRLTIPPYLAYGAKGIPGAIPANATLIFDVELVSIIDKKGK